MRNKKGFTLIELLAVMVILAIIALIAIPIVLKIINNSEKESEKRSVEGYASAIEKDVANYIMMNPGKSYSAYVEEFNKGNINVDYSGNKVKCDPIQIDEEGTLILKNCFVYNDENELNDADKIAKKNHYSYDGNKVSEIKNNNSSTSSTYAEYKIGDQITVAGEQYYVISNSGTNQDYVTALKTEPLTVNDINTYGIGYKNFGHSYSLGISEDYGRVEFHFSSDCGNVNGAYIYSGCTSNYNESSIKHIVDSWAGDKFKFNELKHVGNYSVRLITADELMIYYPNCDLTNDWKCELSSNMPQWLYNSQYWYWTMAETQDSSFAWAIENNGNLYRYANVDYDISVRPVINVYKNKIQ